jgi:hypothetical protein
VSESVSSQSVLRVRVDLSTLQYGAKTEIVPAGGGVYEILVSRVLGKNLPQLLLFLGQSPLPIRGQGDRFYFPGGTDLQISLGLILGGLLNPVSHPPQHWIDLTIVSVPGLIIDTDQIDPFAHARLVSQANKVTAGAALTPSVVLANPFDASLAPTLVNPRVWAHLKRLLITSAIDGEVLIDRANVSTGTLAAIATDEYVVQGTSGAGTDGPTVLLMGGFTNTADPGVAGWKRFDVKAGQMVPIEMALDMAPATGAADAGISFGVRVFGPVGPNTLKVTAEWYELELN